MQLPEFTFRLPDWVAGFLETEQGPWPGDLARMRLAVELARRNVENRTGGPFGAAVFDGKGSLVAPGVNLVVASGCSLLHAEVVAIAIAQQRLGRFDMSDGGRLEFELVSSCEPCAMCFGAIPWSGATRVVCGAGDEDARRIGFDEGPKVDDWAGALQQRGIRVTTGILRDEAVEVLHEYSRSGGSIYNAGGRDSG